MVLFSKVGSSYVGFAAKPSWGQQKYTKTGQCFKLPSAQFTEDGAYMMPTFAPAPREENGKTNESNGRQSHIAWEVYHKKMDGMDEMYMKGRSIVDIFIIWLFAFAAVPKSLIFILYNF